MKKYLSIFGIITFALLSLSNQKVLAQDVQPEVHITSPSDGEEYKDEVVEFLFDTKDFTFVDFKNNTVLFPGNPNAGHAIIWVETLLTGEGSDVAYKVLSADAHHLGALEAGRYRLTVELVKNDRTSFNPRVFDTVTFRARGEGIVSGKYSVMNTSSIINVETPPTPRSGVGFPIVSIVLFIIVLIGIFIRFRKSIIKYTLTAVKSIKSRLGSFRKKK